MVVPQNWYVGNDGSVAALQQPGALLNNYDATSTSNASGAVAARTGTRALQLYSTYGTHLGAYVAMPILNADYDTIQVNFYARPFYQKKDGKVGSSYDNRPLVVGTMTDPNNIATFEPIDSFYYANAAVSTSDLVKNLTDNGWEKFGIRLKGRAGQYPRSPLLWSDNGILMTSHSANVPVSNQRNCVLLILRDIRQR